MLQAGFSETNITPPLDVWMCGYAFRPTGCVGVHDELWARTMVISDGQNRVAIVSMDLLGLDFDLVDKVRHGVEAHTGIPPEALMLHATHTHGGPNVRKINTMGARDEPYVDMLVRKLVGSVRQAANHLEPVTLSCGRSPAQIGINRRAIGPDGISTIGENPKGPVAPHVDTLRMRTADGEERANLFSHACHPTTLGADNLEITADWPGYACEKIRAATGAIPIFLQGCAGNINPRPRGTFENARTHGQRIAEAALKSIESDLSVTGSGVDSAEKVVELPQIPPPPVDECEANIGYWESQVETERRGGDKGRILHAEGLRDFAMYERFLSRQNKPSHHRSFHIQLLNVGGVRIVGFPAEMFIQYQIDLQKQSESPTFVLSYCNGVHGYIPTAADFPFKGYEVEGSHRYYGTLAFSADSESVIRSAAYTLLSIQSPDQTPFSV